MEVRLLGPVGLWHADGEAALVRTHRRCVLAALAMTPGRPVPAETLIDRVWGDNPPRDVVHSLYTHVSAVRRRLEDIDGGAGDAALRRLGGGYVLEVDPDRVDLHRARRHAEPAWALAGDHPAQAVELLREACAQWRGTPLAGLTSTWAAQVRVGLEQERLALVVERFQVELRLGGHAAMVGQLAALLADHPLVEPLAHLQMLALYRCGRQADALEVYAQQRKRLVDELGDEPGPELRQLHEQVLRRDPVLTLGSDRAPTTIAATSPRSGPAAPAQLPPDAAAFVGREPDLSRLSALLPGDGDPQPSAVVISAVDGMAGVGKTTLAVRWAHRVRDRFPDGQLYLNLRGYATDEPLEPIEALSRFLRTLGVPAERVPAEVEEAATMYRSRLADRRVLVVLDNAATPDQVRPLLPGGAGSLVVVTSRDQLGGLVARDGAIRLSLDVLAPEEATALLASILGTERARAEPAALAELAKLCGYLPLALRVAAANLGQRPWKRIADYVEQLRGDDDPLAALAVAGDTYGAVSSAFGLSYTRLPDASRRMFRLLGLVPGADFTAGSAAALAGTTTDRAGSLLEALAGAHLIEERTPGRYAFHDLLRRYAADRAEREEPDRDTARARLYEYFLRTTH